MEVTLFGIYIEVRPEQPENALSPIVTTSSPIIISFMESFTSNQSIISLQWNVIEVRAEHALNAL